MIAHDIKKIMGTGEKVAPVKSIKLKVKFQSADKKKELAKKMVDNKKDK